MADLKEIEAATRLNIRRKIAEGGMGAVYEAEQLGSDGFAKTVAVKTIIKDIAADAEFIEMFIGEAKLVADLVHQNIVQVYQLGRTGDVYYIVMEYVSGINLEQFLDTHRARKTPVPIELATFIASRVCRGLEYAHNKTDRHGELLGVVHRDISPKNLMLTSLGEVKITDFGIAKAQHFMQNREGEVLMGKIQYMSPEQAQFRQTDRRSDLFSLGVVLWELLAGRELFEDADTAVMLDRVISAPLPDIRQFCPKIPPMLLDILTKALTRDLDGRYQDAGKLGHDLEYSIYHQGYGPTIVTLEKYLHKMIPETSRPEMTQRAGTDFEPLGDTLSLGAKPSP